MLDSLISSRLQDYAATKALLRESEGQQKATMNKQFALQQEAGRAMKSLQQVTSSAAEFSSQAVGTVGDHNLEILDESGKVTRIVVISTPQRMFRAWNDFVYNLPFDPMWSASQEGAYWLAARGSESTTGPAWMLEYATEIPQPDTIDPLTGLATPTPPLIQPLTEAHRASYLNYLGHYALWEEIQEVSDTLMSVIKDADRRRNLLSRMTGVDAATVDDHNALSNALTKAIQDSETFDFTSPEGIELMRRRIKTRVIDPAEQNRLLGLLDSVTGAAVEVGTRTCVIPVGAQVAQSALNELLNRLNPSADVITQEGRNALVARLLGAEVGNKFDASVLANQVANFLTTEDEDAELASLADLNINDLGGGVANTAVLAEKLVAYFNALKASGVPDNQIPTVVQWVREWVDRSLGDSEHANYLDFMKANLVGAGDARFSFFSKARAVILGVYDAAFWRDTWNRFKAATDSLVPEEKDLLRLYAFALIPYSVRRKLPEFSGYIQDLRTRIEADKQLVMGMPAAAADAVLRGVSALDKDFVDEATRNTVMDSVFSALSQASPNGDRRGMRIAVQAVSDGVMVSLKDLSYMDMIVLSTTANPTASATYRTFRLGGLSNEYRATLRSELVAEVGDKFKARVSTLTANQVSPTADSETVLKARLSFSEVIWWHDLTKGPSDFVDRVHALTKLMQLRGHDYRNQADLIALASNGVGGAYTNFADSPYYEVFGGVEPTQGQVTGALVSNEKLQVEVVRADSSVSSYGNAQTSAAWSDFKVEYESTRTRCVNEVKSKNWEGKWDDVNARITCVTDSIAKVPARIADSIDNFGNGMTKFVNNMGPKVRQGYDPEDTLYNYNVVGIGGVGGVGSTTGPLVGGPKYDLVGGTKMMSKLHRYMTQDNIITKVGGKINNTLTTLSQGIDHIGDKISAVGSAIEGFQQKVAGSLATIGAKASAAAAKVLCLLDIVHDVLKELNNGLQKVIGVANKVIGGVKGVLRSINNTINAVKDTLMRSANAIANMLQPKIGFQVNCACMSVGGIIGINKRLFTSDDLPDWLTNRNPLIPTDWWKNGINFQIDPTWGCPKNLLKQALPADKYNSLFNENKSLSDSVSAADKSAKDSFFGSVIPGGSQFGGITATDGLTKAGVGLVFK